MQDTILVSVLPYAVMVGIVASVIASIGLVVSTFLRTRTRDVDLLPKLTELEAAIRRDTARIDLQLNQTERGIKPESARSVVSDLSVIANDLQKRASEVHLILDELRSDSAVTDKIENMKSLVNLGLAVGQTETKIEAVVKRIDGKQRELSDLQPTDSTNRG